MLISIFLSFLRTEFECHIYRIQSLFVMYIYVGRVKIGLCR